MSAANITNEIISAYLDQLYDNGNKQLKNLRHFAEKNRVPVITKDTEKLLELLLKLKRPKRLLEIGSAIGYSACFFADCCGCRVTTIEVDHNSFELASVNVREMGFHDRVTVLEGNATELLQKLKNEFGNPKEDGYDIIFIDASKSHYKEFWDMSLPLCREDALIICDNVLMKGMTASEQYDRKGRHKTSIRRMREFIRYINHIEYAETSVLPVGDGVSVSLIGSSAGRSK